MPNKVKTYTPLQWIRALKNPKFQHLQSRLGYKRDDEDGYFACCLGVAAVEMGVATEIQEIVIPTSRRDADATIRYDGDDGDEQHRVYLNDTSLPAWVRPKWLSNANMRSLIQINDHFNTEGYSKQIAYIEKFLVPKWRKMKAEKK